MAARVLFVMATAAYPERRVVGHAAANKCLPLTSKWLFSVGRTTVKATGSRLTMFMLLRTASATLDRTKFQVGTWMLAPSPVVEPARFVSLTFRRWWASIAAGVAAVAARCDPKGVGKVCGPGCGGAIFFKPSVFLEMWQCEHLWVRRCLRGTPCALGCAPRRYGVRPSWR